MTKYDLHKGDKVYYARIMPNLGLYEVCELKIRTVEDDYYVGLEEKTKRAHLFSYKSFDKGTVFKDRKECLAKVKEAEKHKKKDVSQETYYEEY